MKILLLLLLSVPVLGFATPFYVKYKFLKIYENATRTSPVISVVNKGQEIKYLKKKQGMYVNVRYADTSGWVVKHGLSKKPLKEVKRVSVFRGKEDISKKSQKKAATVTSGGMTRSATNDYVFFSGFEQNVSLVVPKEDKQFQAQYKSLENIMNNQADMVDAKEFIK